MKLKSLIGTLSLALALGCGGAGGGEGPKPLRSPLIGYGLVNYWTEVDPEAFAREIQAGHLNFTEIEWAPWHAIPQVGCPPNTSNLSFPEKATVFVRAMQAHGITVLVNLYNVNGCPYPDFAEELSKIPAGVMLSPLSEPWAKSGNHLALAQLARAAWQGPFVLPDKGANRFLGVPYYDFPYDYLDVHFCSEGELFDALAQHNSKLLANTDCSPILNPGPERAKEYAQAALAGGSALMIYDFYSTSPDHATIAALGSALH